MKRKRKISEVKPKKRKIIDLTLDDSDEDSDEEITILPSSPKTETSKREENEEMCAICFEKVKERGKLDSCLHFFCFNCIQKWSLESNQCPLCRRRFNSIVREEKTGSKKKKKKIRVPTRNFRAPREEGISNIYQLIRGMIHEQERLDFSHFTVFHAGINPQPQRQRIFQPPERRIVNQPVVIDLTLDDD